MFHRFNESKYPSTNIQLDISKKQIQIIEKEKIKFILPSELKKNIFSNKKERKILLTIDDGLLSFYEKLRGIPGDGNTQLEIFESSQHESFTNFVIRM